MAINNSKLTSVKVLEDLYNKFRVRTVNSDMNLQRLTNRCIHLYLNNDENIFKSKRTYDFFQEIEKAQQQQKAIERRLNKLNEEAKLLGL